MNHKVYVLKPKTMADGHAEDAISMVQKTKGPLDYRLEEFDYEEDYAPLALEVDVDNEEWAQDAPTVGPNPARRDFGTNNIARINQRRAPRVPIPEEDAKSWIERLQGIEQRFRRERDIKPSDFVLVLTTRGNHQNYFVIPQLEGSRMGGLQVNHFAIQEINSHLIGYYIMALPIMLLAYQDETKEQYLERHAHNDVRGCLNDLCADDVNQLGIKTKTGDICKECKQHFKSVGLDWRLVRQMRDGFEIVRQIQLQLEDFLEGHELPSLTIGREIEIESLGKTIELSPVEKAIYTTFVEAGPEGIHYADIGDHYNQLHSAYGKRYTGSDPQEITRVARKLCDNTNSQELRTAVSNIKRAFVTSLGHEFAELYFISGKRNEAKKIKLPRTLINRTFN